LGRGNRTLEKAGGLGKGVQVRRGGAGAAVGPDAVEAVGVEDDPDKVRFLRVGLSKKVI
jgi:hypothetical protein